MTSQPPSRNRLEFIDLLRGWAVIVMIETHVVNATILREIADSQSFQYVKFINGLVAPSFIFASGLAFAITARRKLAEYTAWGAPLRKQVGRLLFIIAVAYALHLPALSLTQMLTRLPVEKWKPFFQVDVLQLIAVGLLTMQALLFLLRSERRLYGLVAVLMAGILAASPLMWSTDYWDVVPWVLAAYLNGLHYSLFPLFPWMAFLFSGALTGYLYLRLKDRLQERDTNLRPLFSRGLLVAGAAFIALSVLIEPLISSVYRDYSYWLSSPGFVLLRLGIVLVLLGIMVWYEHRRGVSPGSAVTLLGRESFLVYVVHLLMIYGDFGTFNFRKWADHTFGYTEAFLWSILLIALMYLLARSWSRMRSTNPVWKRRIELAVLALVVGTFLISPGKP